MTPSVATAEVDARATPQAWAQPVVAPERVHAPQAASDVTVEVAGGARLAEIQADWRDLAARADVPNVFMHPMLVALSACYPNIRCRDTARLAARRRRPQACRLLGLRRRPRAAFDHSALGAGGAGVRPCLSRRAVIDRDALDETLAAMLDRHRRRHQLAEHRRARRHARRRRHHAGARAACLHARGSTPAVLRRCVAPDARIRTRRQAVHGEGAVGLDAARSCASIGAGSAKRASSNLKRSASRRRWARATEDFLRLEAAGWKGAARHRAALRCGRRHLRARDDAGAGAAGRGRHSRALRSTGGR